MQGSDIIGSHRLLSAILDQAVAESVSRRSSRWSARQWLKLTMAERYFVLLDMDHRAVLSRLAAQWMKSDSTAAKAA